MATRQQDIAVVTFTLATPTFSTEDNFSVPMVMSEITNTDERTQTFSTLEAVQDAGYTSADFFTFANAFFGQAGRKGGTPNNLILGKKLSDANCKQSFTFDADATAGTFTITLGTETTGAIAYDAAVGAVETALEALTAVTSVTCTLNTGATVISHKEGFSIEFDGADATTDFDAMTLGVGSLTSVTTGTVTKTVFGSAVETWGTAYTAIKASNPNFYFVCPDVDATLEATLDTLPSLVEADKRQLWNLTKATDALTSATTDIGSTMLGRFARTHNFYSGDYDNYSLVACELGATIPDFFGATNPSYAPLALITADTLTDSQITNLIAKRYARCESINLKASIMGTSAGSSSAQGVLSTTGVSAKSLWIKDYMEYVISNALVDLFQTNPNVYFSQFWFDAIENLITTIMQTKGVDQGLLLDGSISVTMPDLATYDEDLKLNEVLSGILADSEKTNSISKISITGKIK